MEMGGEIFKNLQTGAPTIRFQGVISARFATTHVNLAMIGFLVRPQLERTHL